MVPIWQHACTHVYKMASDFRLCDMDMEHSTPRRKLCLDDSLLSPTAFSDSSSTTRSPTSPDDPLPLPPTEGLHLYSRHHQRFSQKLKKLSSLPASSLAIELQFNSPLEHMKINFANLSSNESDRVTVCECTVDKGGVEMIGDYSKGTTLFRSQSHPSESTLFPVSPGEGGVEMIGDHSKPYMLPLMTKPRSRVKDLKSITPETLARLLKDDYVDCVEEYTIVDCRYPYEYDGGHIKGAINLWKKEELIKHFFTNPTHDDSRRIVIFHCEFSSRRGPKMSRFMRKIDRDRNGVQFFPRLYYPELYLLHGGYKKFYASNPHLCEPESYKCMLDFDHEEDLKHFSRRSKSRNERES